MGAVCASEEVRIQASTNRLIEKNFDKERRAETGNQKLLLLGAGECGKSTILKQMQILHKNGFTEAEYEERTEVVYSNTVTAMAAILNAMSDLGLRLESTEREMDAKQVLSVIEAGKDAHPFTPDLSQALKDLWADKSVQKAYQRRSEFQVSDSAKFFFDSIDRISNPKYKPTEQDILHTRVPTTGVVQVQFVIKGCTFRVFDVGGQRSERRKWIHLFDDVNAIIFISAVSEYDQVLAEDLKTNRLLESMDLFAQICNSRWFHRASIVLFLNKTDLFAEKLHYSPISVMFPAYKGDGSYDSAINFIRVRFESANEEPAAKKIYTHETCATNTNQVQLVIDAVVDTVISKNLRGTGME